MEIISRHFAKTVLLTTHLGYNIMRDIEQNDNFANFTLTQSVSYFSEYVSNIYFGNLDKLIKEALQIEYKKFQLQDNMLNMIEIQAQERQWNMEREILLNASHDEILKGKFVISPYLYTFESYWKFVWENYNQVEMVLHNIDKPPGDFFFLYQKTGFFDDVTQSNVLEFYLSKFDYFLLELFDTPLSAEMAINNFMSVFDFDSKSEYEKLHIEVCHMLRIMIFRKFIVGFNNLI